MTSFTYSTIKTELIAFTEDDSDDFAAALDTIIANGLMMVVRDLDLEIFKRRATGSFQSGVNTINREADAVAIQSFYYTDTNDNNRRKPMLSRDYDFCVNYWPVATSTNNPKFYNEFSETQILVVPTPSAAFVWEMRILTRPVFNNSNQNTWIATHAGDILFLACLIHSEKFLMSQGDGRVQEWRKEYDDQMPKAKLELQTMLRKDFAPLQSISELGKEV